MGALNAHISRSHTTTMEMPPPPPPVQVEGNSRANVTTSLDSLIQQILDDTAVTDKDADARKRELNKVSCLLVVGWFC